MAAAELYRWTIGAEVLRETSAFTAQTYSAESYTPTSVKRLTALAETSNLDGSRMTLSVPRDHEVAVRFRALPPAQTALEIFEKRGGSFVRIWSGRVVAVTWKGSTAEIAAEPPTTAARLRGLRGMYGPSCRFALYDHRCLVDRTAFKQTFTVAAIDGTLVTLTGLATFVAAQAATYQAAWFRGGELVWSGSRRMVVLHTGDDVTLHAPISDLTVGQSVDLYAGCAHTLDECHGKFGNRANFGGFPLMPNNNPFVRMVD